MSSPQNKTNQRSNLPEELVRLVQESTSISDALNIINAYVAQQNTSAQRDELTEKMKGINYTYDYNNHKLKTVL